MRKGIFTKNRKEIISLKRRSAGASDLGKTEVQVTANLIDILNP